MELGTIDQAYQGFAEGNQEMLESLEKALTAGSGVDAAAFTGGRSMIPESLDTTLVNVLWTQDEAKLFKELKKNPVKSPVHQWVKRTDVGNSDGAWVSEGGDSEAKDQTMARKNVTMKYLQTYRSATLQATVANTLEDAISSEKMAGTLWLIKQIEKILFVGDSACVAEESDGLGKLVTTNIIDMRGKTALTSEFEDAIEEACRAIRAKFGLASHLFGSLKFMRDVQALLRDRMRVGPGVSPSGSAVFEKYDTPFGKPKLIDNLFILERDVGIASTITAKRPAQPTLASAVRSASGGLESKFVAADAGDYYYVIGHENKYGISQLSAAVQCTGVLVDDKVTITVTDGATPGTALLVYRSKKGAAAGTDCRLISRVAYTGAAQEEIDLNHTLPGCSDAFVMTMNPMYDAIEWEQWLPMMKFDLFPTNAAVYPFLMLIFGALAVKK